MKWYILGLKRGLDFFGRSRRREFWNFLLFHSLIILCCYTANILLGHIYIVSTAIPFLAILIRRFHDIGKSGFYLLIGLFPYIGQFFLVIFAITDSDESENSYGQSPKQFLSQY